MSELKKCWDELKPNELIVDCRTPDEFAAGHVPGSRNIPHIETPEHLEELKKYSMVYIYCRTGNRVQYSGAVLAGAGFTQFAIVVQSGFPNWLAAGHPVEQA